jgi:CRISPR type IV-associated protein Csf3
MMKKKELKFEFDPEFQESILRYTVNDRDGYKVLGLFEPHFFSLMEHGVIAQAIKNYFKVKKKVPSKIILREKIKGLINKSDYKKLLTEEDRGKVIKLIDKIYKGNVKDGSELVEEIRLFASYTKMKEAMETMSLKDFTSYPNYLKKIQSAIQIGTPVNESAGTFLIRDINSRIMERKYRTDIHPLPITQLNNFTNAKGYYTGAIITVLDKPKAFKTGLLVNVARMYMKYKKPIIIFDLENGEDSLAMRFEQSLIKKNKLELLSGEYDSQLKKVLRKYSRLGCEIVIKRLYSGATEDDLQYWTDYYAKEYGLKFASAIIDYVGLMGSKDGDTDDNSRIGKAYLGVKNWAERNKINHVWTGHHVVRAAYKKREFRYDPEDTAKCIDIHRHVDVMLGIQQSPEEERGNVLRLEIIDQRDGVQRGACYFKVSYEHQRLDEFTNSEIEAYEKVLSEIRKTDDDSQDYKPTVTRTKSKSTDA